MDNRTLRKIAQQLKNDGIATTRIQGYKYEITEKGDQIIATPLGTGDIASSNVLFDSYAHTHGGEIFREAVNWCKDILAYLVKFRAKDDSEIKIFLDKLQFNGQITRYFDYDFNEYDLSPAILQIRNGNKIFVALWSSQRFTTLSGYECIYEYGGE